MSLCISKLLIPRPYIVPKMGTESMKRTGGKAIGRCRAVWRSCQGITVGSMVDVGCSASIEFFRVKLKRMARVKPSNRVGLVVEAKAAGLRDAELLPAGT